MFVMVDIEADGPIPGDSSMVSLGAVIVEPTLSQTFYGRWLAEHAGKRPMFVSDNNAEALLAMKHELGLKIGLK